MMLQDIEFRYVKVKYGNILQIRKLIGGVWTEWEEPKRINQ